MTQATLRRHTIACAALSLLAFAAGSALAFPGEELAKGVKVTIAEARAAALKAKPGKISSEELENEEGGSGLRYSFDIDVGGVTHEVGVDAMTGKILEND